MKRYEHLMLENDGRVVVYSVDKKIVDRITALIRRYVGGEIEVKRSNGYKYRFSKLRSRDNEVFYWLIYLLCKNGWEPYAVSSHVWGGGQSISSFETHHFRRESQDTTGE